MTPHSKRTRSLAHATRVGAATLIATGLIAVGPIATGAIDGAPAASASEGSSSPTGSAQLVGSAQFPGSSTPTQHAGAPRPEAFSSTEYGWYLSDLSSHPFGIYASIIDGFHDLRAQHPEVMESNLEQVIAINNAAASDPELIARAQRDAQADKQGVLEIYSDALGEELGAHFRSALREHRLPKTQMLFGGVTARAGGLASSTFAEKVLYNNDRPFVVAPEKIRKYNEPGQDYYATSKSFPSGHTNQATWTTTLLAYMLPELGSQLLARGSEGGYHRLVLGVHYPLDVIGGRMTGLAAAADRLNDPRMRANLDAAAREVRAELEWRCGDSLDKCVARQTQAGKSYSQDPVGEYTQRMNYGFSPVSSPDAPMIVPQAAPVLLAGRYPQLSYAQRAEILRQTASPAGYPLDKQGQQGSWQRLNIAKALSVPVRVPADGSVQVGMASPTQVEG